MSYLNGLTTDCITNICSDTGYPANTAVASATYNTLNNYATTGTASIDLSDYCTITPAYASSSITINMEPGGVVTYTNNPTPKSMEIEIKQKSPMEKKIEERINNNKKINSSLYFTNIEEYVPYKVYEFTFGSGKKVKTVCDESDEFSLRKAFFIAIAKRKYQSTLTPEGIVKKAEEMMYEKSYIKIVEGGIKLFKLLKEKEEWEKKEEEREKIKHDKYIQKKIERKNKQKEKENDELRKVIAEAIKESKK